MTFKNELQEPERTEWAYTLPFSAANVGKIYQKADKKKIQFVLINDSILEPGQLKSGTLESALTLFKEKSFDYLFRANYMSPEEKEENRRQAITRG